MNSPSAASHGEVWFETIQLYHFSTTKSVLCVTPRQYPVVMSRFDTVCDSILALMGSAALIPAHFRATSVPGQRGMAFASSLSRCSKMVRRTTMHIAMSEATTKFPTITFRKKRLTVAICAHFDMGSAEDASTAKEMIEEAIQRLTQDGQAKITYSVADL